MKCKKKTHTHAFKLLATIIHLNSLDLQHHATTWKWKWVATFGVWRPCQPQNPNQSFKEIKNKTKSLVSSYLSIIDLLASLVHLKFAQNLLFHEFFFTHMTFVYKNTQTYERTIFTRFLLLNHGMRILWCLMKSKCLK